MNAKRSSRKQQETRSPFLAYQKRALAGVSRTFALTIPLLPTQVRHAIGNAYLLCRIADTIEDEPALADELKQVFLGRFAEVVLGRSSTESFANDLSSSLSEATHKSERDLVSNTSPVVDYHTNLPSGQREPIERCVETMCEGMAEFVGTDSAGLPTMTHVERYCYVVAGVVGEMITEVLCDYSNNIDSRKIELSKLSVPFGRGLQLVNILKDHREDRKRGVTWLPRQVFDTRGGGMRRHGESNIVTRIKHVVNVAQRDLEAALRYIQLIPTYERGVRSFLAITLGLAVLTLRRIQLNPGFQRGDDVKISRRQVYGTVATTRFAVRSNHALNWLFNLAKPTINSTLKGLW